MDLALNKASCCIKRVFWIFSWIVFCVVKNLFIILYWIFAKTFKLVCWIRFINGIMYEFWYDFLNQFIFTWIHSNALNFVIIKLSSERKITKLHLIKSIFFSGIIFLSYPPNLIIFLIYLNRNLNTHFSS